MPAATRVVRGHGRSLAAAYYLDLPYFGASADTSLASSPLGWGACAMGQQGANWAGSRWAGSLVAGWFRKAAAWDELLQPPQPPWTPRSRGHVTAFDLAAEMERIDGIPQEEREFGEEILSAAPTQLQLSARVADLASGHPAPQPAAEARDPPGMDMHMSPPAASQAGESAGGRVGGVTSSEAHTGDCEPFCAAPCSELNGDVGRECGGCGAELACNPSSPDFREGPLKAEL